MAYILNTSKAHHLPTFAAATKNFLNKTVTAIAKAQETRAENYISKMKFYDL
ncbi:MAG: hypothetical protein COB13_001265 [OCS116 cluster bacterium]|nr:hypothetical protein [OCS116 cluster bacterium]